MVAVEQLPRLRASQQPGKPKPPGNPPNRPDPDEMPVDEPPAPIPTPSPDDEPPPMQTAGCGCVQEVTRRMACRPRESARKSVSVACSLERCKRIDEL
jgi:hypothetical protein